MGRYCCTQMKDELNSTCELHADRWECADALIGYWPDSHEYGLIVHDGGSSMITISFCPWCGADLRHAARPTF